MAQKTYTVSQSGTYKVRAVASNGRYADSNEVNVTIATVQSGWYTISGDGENLVILYDIAGYSNLDATKTILVAGNAEPEAFSVPDKYINVIDQSDGNVKITATIPMTEIRKALSESTSIASITVVSEQNGIVGTDGQRSNKWSIELEIASASYDIVSDTITAVLTASAPPMFAAFTFTKVPDGSFEFKLGEKTGIVGDLQDDGKTIKIQNATSQVGSSNLNAPKDLSLMSYTASVEEYGLYTVKTGSASSVTVRSIAKPVLTYDAATKTLKWGTVEGATSYEVYKGDSKVTTVT